MSDAQKDQLIQELLWLNDAPLFIDAPKIASFYDATVRPANQEAGREIVINTQNLNRFFGQAGAEAGIGTADLPGFLSLLSKVIPGEIKAEAKGELELERKKEQHEKITLQPIATPQRQLVQLALHYLSLSEKRLFLVTDPAQEEWRTRENISRLPRPLVFLDLPAKTKFIPTAAEFANGKIITLFDKLKPLTDRMQPRYPEPEKYPDDAALRQERRKYWDWFESNFNATNAMTVVEEAAAANGRIRWIDYRLPLTPDGDTLHLHICPAERHDTGDFAYNFIKRGYKHGLRLVGTLRSEPDMNVLAIYDK